MWRKRWSVINHRTYNPFTINLFFTILSRSVLLAFDKNVIKKHQYILPGEFDLNENLKFQYDELSLFEPYYCFFLYALRNNFSFLYLDASTGSDNITTHVIYNGKQIGLHTWYARLYNKNVYQTKRINNILKPHIIENNVDSERIHLT